MIDFRAHVSAYLAAIGVELAPAPRGYAAPGWDESKHPRATDGEFAETAGEDHGGGAATAVEEEPEHPREKFRKTPAGTKRGDYTKDRKGETEFWRGPDGKTITDEQAWERFGGTERDVPDPEIEKLDVGQIEVDPERFQFKQKARSAAGTTDQFADVGKFYLVKAGVILAWRDREGRTWVVDGHHRVELAKRTGHPRINAFVLEEAQGVTHVQARATAALRNIATGHGEALDAAKAVRDMGWTVEDLKAEGISAKSAIVRDALGLASLDDSVFSRVIDEEIPQSYAAEIGRQLEGKPGKQIQAANAIGTAGNQAEVESIVRQIRAAPEVTTTQETLFGEETETRSLFAQRAKVEVALARLLKGDKALFKTLADKAAKAEAGVEGNKINVEGSRKVASGADELMLTLRSYGDKAGPVKEALDDAARRFGDGVPLAEAVTGALDALKAVDVWSGERRDDAPEPEARGGSLLDGLPDPEPDAGPSRDAVRTEDAPRRVREPERAPVGAAPAAAPEAPVERAPAPPSAAPDAPAASPSMTEAERVARSIIPPDVLGFIDEPDSADMPKMQQRWREGLKSLAKTISERGDITETQGLRLPPGYVLLPQGRPLRLQGGTGPRPRRSPRPRRRRRPTRGTLTRSGR